MDDWTAGVYVRELLNQSEAAQIASDDLKRALASDALDSVARAFAAAQLLLAAGAMVSKMLWPQPPATRLDGSALSDAQARQRQRTLDRGRHLRDALVIKSIPILENRKVRNALEHFDDRLDRYFEQGHKNVFDRNIGPKDQLIVVGGASPLHLRLIDPQAGTVSILEDEVSMGELLDVIHDIARRSSAWLVSHGR